MAKLLGTVLSSCHSDATWRGAKKKMTPDEISNILATCFLKAPSTEVRVGVAQAYVVYFVNLGPTWLEKQAASVTKALLQLLVQVCVCDDVCV